MVHDRGGVRIFFDEKEDALSPDLSKSIPKKRRSQNGKTNSTRRHGDRKGERPSLMISISLYSYFSGGRILATRSPLRRTWILPVPEKVGRDEKKKWREGV